jgi:hypothetical protein
MYRRQQVKIMNQVNEEEQAMIETSYSGLSLYVSADGTATVSGSSAPYGDEKMYRRVVVDTGHGGTPM